MDMICSNASDTKLSIKGYVSDLYRHKSQYAKTTQLKRKQFLYVFHIEDKYIFMFLITLIFTYSQINDNMIDDFSQAWTSPC